MTVLEVLPVHALVYTRAAAKREERVGNPGNASVAGETLRGVGDGASAARESAAVLEGVGLAIVSWTRNGYRAVARIVHRKHERTVTLRGRVRQIHQSQLPRHQRTNWLHDSMAPVPPLPELKRNVDPQVSGQRGGFG